MHWIFLSKKSSDEGFEGWGRRRIISRWHHSYLWTSMDLRNGCGQARKCEMPHPPLIVLHCLLKVQKIINGGFCKNKYLSPKNLFTCGINNNTLANSCWQWSWSPMISVMIFESWDEIENFLNKKAFPIQTKVSYEVKLTP